MLDSITLNFMDGTKELRPLKFVTYFELDLQGKTPIQTIVWKGGKKPDKFSIEKLQLKLQAEQYLEAFKEMREKRNSERTKRKELQAQIDHLNHNSRRLEGQNAGSKSRINYLESNCNHKDEIIEDLEDSLKAIKTVALSKGISKKKFRSAFLEFLSQEHPEI